jgi:hypothetical protein
MRARAADRFPRVLLLSLLPVGEGMKKKSGNAPRRRRSGTVALSAESRKFPLRMAVFRRAKDPLPSVRFQSDDLAAPPLPCSVPALLRGESDRRTGRFLLWNFRSCHMA